MERDAALPEVMVRLQAGDAKAAEVVFHRFARRLIGLARKRLDPLLRTAVEPEDVVQSVFRSFFRRQGREPFRIPAEWDDLWRLLALITVRKCAKKSARAKRALGVVHGGDELESLDLASGREPTPEEAATLADTIEELMRGLKPHEREVLVLRLQGCGTGEIAGQIQSSVRRVQRALERAGRRLERLNDDSGVRP